MAKTTFSSGVIVTSQWLNGAQQIYFDGQDLDWHYAPLGLDSLVTGGPNGLDSRYVTLTTSQPTITPVTVTIPDPANPAVNITYTSYRILSGSAISGDKITTGYWAFGADPGVVGNPTNNIANAPLSFTTNDKYNFANGTLNPSVAQKYAALIPADIITKEILTEQIADALDFLEIDNGFYYYEDGAGVYTCNNYSVPGSTPDPLSFDFICGT